MGKSYAAIKFNRDAEENRKIYKFQPPFNLKSINYNNKLTFSNETHKMCKNNCETLAASFTASKVIILGDASVGKTSIVNRFCHKLFETNYKATIGVDFEVERFDILEIPYNMQIWDTAGQERFKSIAQSYYRGARVVVIVFDLTNIYSLNNCQKWLQEALYASGDDGPLLFVVGTKKDLLSSAAYKSVEKSAIFVANKLKAEYWCVSSKSGENIKEFFFRVACLSFEETLSKDIHDNQKLIGSDLVSFKKNSNKEVKRSCLRSQCNLK